MTDPNHPATAIHCPSDQGGILCMGLTKREEFAKAAMQGLLCNCKYVQAMSLGDSAMVYASAAVEIADALIKALNANQ